MSPIKAGSKKFPYDFFLLQYGKCTLIIVGDWKQAKMNHDRTAKTTKRFHDATMYYYIPYERTLAIRFSFLLFKLTIAIVYFTR